MRMLNPLIVLGAFLALAGVAAAVQPGTRGTEKSLQESGFRSAVLIQKNNTATASAGAATLNAAGSGVITTESLTTSVGSDYTLTLTNNMIEAGDVVVAMVGNGTNTGGAARVQTVAPAAGSVVIGIINNPTGTGGANTVSPFNGTLAVRFVVVKQSANGSD
jgi:hypothetical protein